ncbi:cytochrome P450 [Mycena epipterygia]|nr:cytochrome P450 [Mycena epipterygia]
MTSVDMIILLLYCIAALTTISWLWGVQKQQPIPALIGSSGFLSSCTGAYHFFHHAADIVRKGYMEDRNGVFRIPRWYRWDYVANGTKRIAEVAAAPNDILSFEYGVEEVLQGDYTMGPEITINPYHAHTVRSTLTRNIGRCFPIIREEIVASFDDVLALDNADWKAFTVLPNILHVIARTSIRVFVGLPLCRNKEYLNLSIAYSVAMFKQAQIINMFPNFLKPLIGPLISSKQKTIRAVMKLLGPLIEDRLAKEAELGPNWPDKPNDFLSWLIDDAEDRTPSAIAMRLLVLNVAAIHTSSMALTNALFDLTTYPSHIAPMREEAEHAVREGGWTKKAVNDMHKIDSFLRESQRLNASSPVSMLRKVVAKEGFRFSDGTVIPYGSFVGVSGRLVQHDPAIYDQAGVFDGFRFSRMREEDKEGEGIFKCHMVSTAADHLPFGHGRHACPGRFFAATEIKAMLAHVLINYDIKADNEGVRPPEYTFGQVRGPNPRAKIWIRRRQ